MSLCIALVSSFFFFSLPGFWIFRQYSIWIWKFTFVIVHRLVLLYLDNTFGFNIYKIYSPVWHKWKLIFLYIKDAQENSPTWTEVSTFVYLRFSLFTNFCQTIWRKDCDICLPIFPWMKSRNRKLFLLLTLSRESSNSVRIVWASFFWMHVYDWICKAFKVLWDFGCTGKERHKG